MGISIRTYESYVQSMKRVPQSLSVHIDRSARNGSTFEVPMKSVKEICRLTGVTRKTLFYYDRIGLLKPTRRVGSQAHKYYDEEAVETLQKIRLYKECGLKISEIRTMINEPDLSERYVLEYGIRRLRNSRTEIDERIFLVRLLQITGVSSRMIRILSAFSSSEICRIGTALLQETALAKEMKEFRLVWPDEGERIRLIINDPHPDQSGNSRKLAILLLADSSAVSPRSRVLLHELLEKENSRYVLNEQQRQLILEPLHAVSLLAKEPADSERVQLQAEKIAVLLAEEGKETALARIFAMLCEDPEDTGLSSHAEAVLWIFWLKHAFAETEGKNE